MRNVDRLIEGLQILKKYGEVCVCGVHDRLVAGWDTEDEPELSAEDLKRLQELQWHDTGRDRFSCLQWALYTLGTEE